jgi:hypothetical protein
LFLLDELLVEYLQEPVANSLASAPVVLGRSHFSFGVNRVFLVINSGLVPAI